MAVARAWLADAGRSGDKRIGICLPLKPNPLSRTSVGRTCAARAAASGPTARSREGRRRTA
jgi:hypothetical protein